MGDVGSLCVVMYLQRCNPCLLLPLSSLDPGVCGAPTLILGPAWLGPKKEVTSVGPLLCARHFKFMIALDSVL